jgi:signal transduction histidine kinase
MPLGTKPSSMTPADLVRRRERLRLAKRLHDQPIQTLAVLLMQLSEFSAQSGKPAIPESDDWVLSIQELARELRQFVRQLQFHPEPDLEPEKYFRGVINNAAILNAVVMMDFTLESNRYWPVAVLELFGLAISELLTNAQQHSGATQICVAVAETELSYRLCVVDDGCGFNLAEIPQDEPTGLNDLRWRCEEIEGSLTIESAKGQGARIVLQLPKGR